jgi:NAD(P)H-dependent FMN reductase
MAGVAKADLILWAFPVYFLLVPAGYRRFIELVHERGSRESFAGKYAASFSTSIHYHDDLPHEYLRGISEDLGMRYAGSFAAGMKDLLKAGNRKHLLSFGTMTFRRGTSACARSTASFACCSGCRRCGRPSSRA